MSIALLRLSFDRQFIARGPFELLVRSADEAGRMLGGWRSQAQGLD
jgi:hypothetical protein